MRLIARFAQEKETIGDCPVHATSFRDTFSLKDKVDNFGIVRWIT